MTDQDRINSDRFMSHKHTWKHAEQILDILYDLPLDNAAAVLALAAELFKQDVRGFGGDGDWIDECEIAARVLVYRMGRSASPRAKA